MLNNGSSSSSPGANPSPLEDAGKVGVLEVRGSKGTTKIGEDVGVAGLEGMEMS